MALFGATLTKRVSIWTSSPGLEGFMPLGRRLAWRWPMRRKRHRPGLRRSVGTGVTTPLAISFVRMRPTIETETAIPSRRKRTASLRLPHIGWSARRCSIRRTSALVQLGRGCRCGLLERGSSRAAQRSSEARLAPTALAASSAVSPCERA